MPVSRSWTKTEKQVEATDLQFHHYMTLLEGGARSGKTFITIFNQIMCGVSIPSKHLAVRQTLVSARRSLVKTTIRDVVGTCFPPEFKQSFRYNGSDHIYTFPCRNGGQSELWIGGVDSEAQMEKILGNEFSTIFCNEASEMQFVAIELLRTRLAETSGLRRRFWLDQNPTVRTHWIWKLFREHLSPKREAINWDMAYLQMNPVDNRANLDDDYIDELDNSSEKFRRRFYLGEYTEEVEGALWTEEMVNDSKQRTPGKIRRTVVAVDPSVSHTADSDECGIVVASDDDINGAIVHGDFSGLMSTDVWARRAVDLYHEWEANCIVIEVNQGGDLCKDAIHNVDPNVPVEMVRASKSKYARAEPVAQLYQEDQRRVTHEVDMPELEEELTTYVPRDAKYSPNRLDALVWALTFLAVGGSSDFDIAGF